MPTTPLAVTAIETDLRAHVVVAGHQPRNVRIPFANQVGVAVAEGTEAFVDLVTEPDQSARSCLARAPLMAAPLLQVEV
jgi:hypothetical protein